MSDYNHIPNIVVDIESINNDIKIDVNKKIVNLPVDLEVGQCNRDYLFNTVSEFQSVFDCPNDENNLSWNICERLLTLGYSVLANRVNDNPYYSSMAIFGKDGDNQSMSESIYDIPKSSVTLPISNNDFTWKNYNPLRIKIQIDAIIRENEYFLYDGNLIFMGVVDNNNIKNDLFGTNVKYFNSLINNKWADHYFEIFEMFTNKGFHIDHVEKTDEFVEFTLYPPLSLREYDYNVYHNIEGFTIKKDIKARKYMETRSRWSDVICTVTSKLPTSLNNTILEFRPDGVLVNFTFDKTKNNKREFLTYDKLDDSELVEITFPNGTDHVDKIFNTTHRLNYSGYNIPKNKFTLPEKNKYSIIPDIIASTENVFNDGLFLVYDDVPIYKLGDRCFNRFMYMMELISINKYSGSLVQQVEPLNAIKNYPDFTVDDGHILFYNRDTNNDKYQGIDLDILYENILVNSTKRIIQTSIFSNDYNKSDFYSIVKNNYFVDGIEIETLTTDDNKYINFNFTTKNLRRKNYEFRIKIQ